MTGDETAALARDNGTADGTGPLPFDITKAHQARVYNYLLGGKDNYAADRAAAAEGLKVYPQMAVAARANRAFLGRTVRFLAAEAGIRQFLDIGTGIPTAGNTHEVAQSTAPESRVVYVDYDPIVLAHARALMTNGGEGGTDYIHADLRDTGTVLDRTGELLDFTKPVAITLLAILHSIQDADHPYAIVARLLDAVPSGSYVALSHVRAESFDAETRSEWEDIIRRTSQQQYTARTREQVARFFTGTDLVAPGVVPLEAWRPEPGTGQPGPWSMWCGVGRKC